MQIKALLLEDKKGALVRFVIIGQKRDKDGGLVLLLFQEDKKQFSVVKIFGQSF